MKKIFMSAAVMALFTCSCTENEMIENVSDGQAFTLEVNQGVGSRTALDGNQTVWSQGDEIYVTSANGRVTGVLTLKQGVGSANGTFEGFIFGGEPSELEHIVFPVPEDGKIPMGKTSSVDKLDIPMTGSIESGQLSNVGGLIKLPITAGANVDLNVKNGETEVLCGHYEFESSTGELTFVPDPNGSVKITVPAEGFVLLPVATDNVQGVEESELEDEVAIEVNDEVAVVAPVEEGKVSENTVPEVEVGEEGEISTKVDTEARLVSAIAVGGYIKLDGAIELANILEIPAKAEVELDLNGMELIGEISNKGNLTITDSSEVYKRVASTLGVTSTEGAVTNVIGGTYSAEAKITPAADYSLVKDGENSVVLPTKNYLDGPKDETGKSLQDAINSIEEGGVLYLGAGTYKVDHVSGYGDIVNKSMTIVGLNDAKIKNVGTRGAKYGLRVSNDTEKTVCIKNLEIESEWASIYVKGNSIVNLYDLRIDNGIHLDVASSLPTSSLCAKHTYNNGKEDVTTTWAPEGTKAVVNAYNVTSTIENGEIWADLLTMPCYYDKPYKELTLNTTTIAEFNYVGGDVKGAFANGITRSKGDNMFVNGIALPAYQAPAEDAE